MKLELVNETNKILHEKAKTWDFKNPPFDSKILVEQMLNIMRENHGIGLALPQLDISYNMFIMEYKTQLWICFNPTIKTYDEELISENEGCLSYPHLIMPIKRSKSIVATYYDENENFHEEKMEDIVARCFQHELDHLNGITFDKKVSKMVLNMAKRKRKKHFK